MIVIYNRPLRMLAKLCAAIILLFCVAALCGTFGLFKGAVFTAFALMPAERMLTFIRGGFLVRRHNKSRS